MGVQARIVLYAPDSVRAERAASAAFARIATLDDILSNYRPTSELMRLSAASGGPPVRVSSELFTILSRAQQLATISDGAFDITVGPYAKLWRNARLAGRLPNPELLEKAAIRVGWEKVRLDPGRRTVQLLVPDMELDPGGIAKGYAGDQALAVMRSHGIRSALIEFGGDIVAGDPPPGEPGWLIRIENALPGKETIQLSNQAISSSGDTVQYVEIDGTRYSHIVDPRTGLGLTDRIAVTIIAPNGLTSDGLSTMVSVLGPDRSLPLLRRHFPQARAFVRHVADSAAVIESDASHRNSRSQEQPLSRTALLIVTDWPAEHLPSPPAPARMSLR